MVHARIQHIERWHGVADVHHARLGMDVEHDTVHDSDERILQSKVGGEGDDARFGHDRKLVGCGSASQADRIRALFHPAHLMTQPCEM